MLNKYVEYVITGVTILLGILAIWTAVVLLFF